MNTSKSRYGTVSRRVAAGALVVLILSSIVIATFLVKNQANSLTSSSSSVASTSTTRSSQSTALSISFGDPVFPKSCPNGCVVNFSWPDSSTVYSSMPSLINASWFIFVGNVTGAWTTIVENDPITLYNVTATETLKIVDSFGYIPMIGNNSSQVAEGGGKAGNNTYSLEGYPTLTVGATYVFFLSPSGDVNAPFADRANISYPPGLVLMTPGGPQGLFYVQGGNVYSLDNMYPQADSWIPTKVSGVPLSQFVQEIQADVNSTTTSSTTSISTSSVAPSP